MKIEEKKKYDDNLTNYSCILRGEFKTREEILECIKIFEYFEDYEKCEDLVKFLEHINSKSPRK